MSRSAAAVIQSPHAASSPPTAPRSAKKHAEKRGKTVMPANDTAATSTATAPVYVLTAADRAALTAEARALPSHRVVAKLPSLMNERVAWLKTIQARAWRDRAQMTTVSFDGPPLTEEAIDAMGRRVAFAKEVIARRGGVAAPIHATTTAVEQMSDTQVAEEMHTCCATLCNALGRLLRHATAAPEVLRAKRSTVQTARRARTDAGHGA